MPKKMPKKKTHDFPAVLFDLDGTLIDSVYEHIRAWREALSDAGIALSGWKIHQRVGMSGKSFLRELLREIDVKASPSRLEALEKAHDASFGRMIPELQALPGADPLLRHLDKSGVRIAIATTGNRKQTELLLKKIKVPSGMPVVTGDDVKKAKPAPDIFVAAANQVQVPIGDCIVVGDSVWDLLAAGRKGALGVGLMSGGYGLNELERAGAFRIYSDAADMLLHLEQLGLPGV
jgi:HAD superfamily hydrolase (TIGR01549 family)